MERRQTFSERFDWTLCLIIFLFFIISCIIIASAQTNNVLGINYVIRQVIFYIIGIFLIAFIMFFDPDQIKRMTWYLYGLGLFLLLMIAVIPGSTDKDSFVLIRNGAKSWFQLPGIGQLQPSEFMKIFLILALSRAATQHNQFTPIKTLKTDLFLLLKLGTLTIIPLGFIATQPDLGTSLVIISIFLGIVLISGISWKILIPAFSMVAAIGVFLIYMVLKFPDFLQEHFNFDPYQFNRIYSWLEPEKYAGSASYQLLQSLKAIGSGMMEGKGFNERVVIIPEVHTDFIFSVIGEEWGFIGGSLIIGLYFVLIYHLTKIALNTTDSFNSYICGGVISMITFHVLENIGMTIQLLPITGIPLPFISYGGSALMTNMMAMGLIFSIHLHHKTYMFSSRDRIPIPKNNRKIAH